MRTAERGNKMRKQDRRNLYTENVTREAVFDLLKVQPVNKLSVSEVCKRADINRSTFYLHYKDCYHVLEKEQERFCDKLIDYMESDKNEDPVNIILNLHKIIREDNELFLILLRNGDPMQSFKKFLDYGKRYLINKFAASAGLTEMEADWIAEYIIAGSFSITLRYYSETKDNIHREELIHKLINKGLDGLVSGDLYCESQSRSSTPL